MLQVNRTKALIPPAHPSSKPATNASEESVAASDNNTTSESPLLPKQVTSNTSGEELRSVRSVPNELVYAPSLVKPSELRNKAKAGVHFTKSAPTQKPAIKAKPILKGNVGKNSPRSSPLLPPAKPKKPGVTNEAEFQTVEVEVTG